MFVVLVAPEDGCFLYFGAMETYQSEDGYDILMPFFSHTPFCRDWVSVSCFVTSGCFGFRTASNV